MCAGNEFQVDDAETENAREVKLLVMPEGLARRFVLENTRLWMEGSGSLVRTGKEDVQCRICGVECFPDDQAEFKGDQIVENSSLLSLI